MRTTGVPIPLPNFLCRLALCERPAFPLFAHTARYPVLALAVHTLPCALHLPINCGHNRPLLLTMLSLRRHPAATISGSRLFCCTDVERCVDFPKYWQAKTPKSP